MEKTYLLAAGDRRQFWLSRFLVPKGQVYTLGVPGLEDNVPDQPVDALILPTPCFTAGGRLHGQREGLDPSALSGLYDEHTRVYGGAVPEQMETWLPGCSHVTDLLLDPAVKAANGRLTAEAAVELTAERLEGSLFGLPCLILGYGCVAKPLASLLMSLHASVTVAARRAAARAEAVQGGCLVCDFNCLPASPRVVFNTVPAAVLKPDTLNILGEECLWVELASVPGGLPTGYDPNFSVLRANSLPGRRLPRSAAATLLEGILRCEVNV
ncbi:MAG: hypothetical protein IIY94_00570 [Oscillospiraceae bacterium]|nr:hypothetical protein [Oscillospiraceae bacterium]